MANQFKEYITSAEFMASSFGRGTLEADADVFCDVTNSIIESVIDYWYVEGLTGADKTVAYKRIKSAGMLIATAIKSNPSLLREMTIGKLSTSFNDMENISKAAAQLISPYVAGGGSGGGFAVADLER